MKHMTGPETAREASVLPGSIQMETRVGATGVMADPSIVRVHVGRVRMPMRVPVSLRRRRAARLCSFGSRGWTVRGHVSSANRRMLLSLFLIFFRFLPVALRHNTDIQPHRDSQKCSDLLHVSLR
jgi:hypothetical protein